MKQNNHLMCGYTSIYVGTNNSCHYTERSLVPLQTAPLLIDARWTSVGILHKNFQVQSIGSYCSTAGLQKDHC